VTGQLTGDVAGLRGLRGPDWLHRRARLAWRRPGGDGRMAGGLAAIEPRVHVVSWKRGMAWWCWGRVGVALGVVWAGVSSP